MNKIGGSGPRIVLDCGLGYLIYAQALKRGSPSELDVRPSSRFEDNLHIENFKRNGLPLEKVTPDKVRRLSLSDSEKGVKAIARLLHISNKEIAHPTIGRTGEDDGTDVQLLIIGGNGIRALTVSYFYTALYLHPPGRVI